MTIHVAALSTRKMLFICTKSTYFEHIYFVYNTVQDNNIKSLNSYWMLWKSRRTTTALIKFWPLQTWLWSVVCNLRTLNDSQMYRHPKVLECPYSPIPSCSYYNLAPWMGCLLLKGRPLKLELWFTKAEVFYHAKR